jgi:pimeloyl-ACP methyl ester carboxylesterase
VVAGPVGRVLAAAVVVVTGLAAGCSTSVGEKGRASGAWPVPPSSTSTTRPGRSPAPPVIEWSACGAGECGRLAVPLDHDAPQATIDLALYRRPAGDPDLRIGSLLVNPGGPGASGVELARGADNFLPEDVLDRFDVVGWDPRGTGDSAPVRCGNRLDYLFSGDTGPDDPGEWQALDAISRRFAEACGAGTGTDLLANISTLDTVRDMEQIRLGLGEERLTFVGFSYGTTLGSLYATLYPDRVRAMVLDGAVDTSLSGAELVIQQSEGLERAFDAFVADCRADPGCPVDGEPAAVYEAVDLAVESGRLRGGSGAGRVVTPAMFDVAVSAALYHESTWPDLAAALESADDGDGRGLLDLLDGYLDRAADGTYSVEWAAFLAISCLDGPSVGSAEAYRAVAAAAAARAPRFGAPNVGLGLACAFWPVPPAAPLPPVAAPGAAPIVVVGTTGDPITPMPWSAALARQLAGSGHLVLVDRRSHTSFGSGSVCVDDPVAAYLVDLTLPPSDPC